MIILRVESSFKKRVRIKGGGAAGAQSYNSKETDPANNLTERGGRFFPILCPQ